MQVEDFMFRTQVYLSETEKKNLNMLVKSTGKSQSTLIREALDEFIDKHANAPSNKLELIQSAKGLWADRDDLPNFDDLRKEFDR